MPDIRVDTVAAIASCDHRLPEGRKRGTPQNVVLN
jgi:hypothetical protein